MGSPFRWLDLLKANLAPSIYPLRIQAIGIQEEMAKSNGGDAGVIAAHAKIVLHYNDFLEGVPYCQQRTAFLLSLFLIWQGIGGLQIVFLVASIGDEINLQFDILYLSGKILLMNGDHSDIDLAAMYL